MRKLVRWYRTPSAFASLANFGVQPFVAMTPFARGWNGEWDARRPGVLADRGQGPVIPIA